MPAAPRRFMILLSQFSCSHFPSWACFTQLCLVLNIFCRKYHSKAGPNHRTLSTGGAQCKWLRSEEEHRASLLYWNLSHTSECQLSSLPAIWCKLNCEIYGYKGIQHRKSWYQWHSYTSLLLDKFCQQFCNQPLGAAAGLLICWAANTRGVKVVNSTWKNSVLA